jgi:DNA-binding transcriptional LysR family regulator
MSVSARVLLNRLLAKARFRHLQVLVRLAELGSVKRTAESIGMTQPAVTQLLADLERLLEVALFHRHARGVLPTAVCRDILPMARQCLAGLSAGAEAVAERADLGKGVVRIAASTAAINGLLVRALPAFNTVYPGIQLHVREAEINDQFMGIARQEVDLGFCRESAVVPEGWRFVPLMPDEFVVACSPGHPLARRRKLKWTDLADQTWVPSTIGSAARTRLDELCAQFDTPPKMCQVITRVSSMTWAMLQQQTLLTLVPASVFRQLRDAHQLVTLNLRDPLPFDALGMLLPVRDVPSATQRVADFLHAFCTNPGSTPA